MTTKKEKAAQEELYFSKKTPFDSRNKYLIKRKDDLCAMQVNLNNLCENVKKEIQVIYEEMQELQDKIHDYQKKNGR